MIELMIVAFLFLLGLVFGSFVNALVWRLHEQASSKKKRADKRLSIVEGRSMCPHCKHELAAQDLVPVFSWLWLRGRCRYCHKPISAQYPIVETITALVFSLSYVTWPYELDAVGIIGFAFFLVFAVFFMALALYDLRWFLLPDKLVRPLTGLAVLQVLVIAFVNSDPVYVLHAAFGGVLIFGLFWALFQLSKGRWIGGGDVKLALALGLIVGGPIEALLVVFLASLLGSLMSIPLMLQGKQGFAQHIPFGPYLLTAALLVVLFGQRVIDWYQGILI